ncbi:MAG: 1-acyl-sn-glycerol-3-phosphate acyltransferase [Oscillospiraceae bacterium]|jgi:hypothetical protein|nr:1-acyl-sn-glycerol-3-phosphate acyltransferase [Oscillospiraceae bacterium]
MVGKWKRFNAAKRPKRQPTLLKPIIWGVSFPKAWAHKSKVDKSEMPKGANGVKPPYLLLCNHNSFMDFMIMSKAIFPHRANYVVAIDGFLINEWLLRRVGCIGNRKFTRSITLVRNMVMAKDRGDIVVLFPEARYSLCGTNAVLPESLSKMIRRMNVPVVTLIMHGHHINSPFWNVGNRHIKQTTAEMKQILTKEETQSLPISEIMERVNTAFVYDDFAWQQENKISIDTPDRAEGLHNVLYQCCECGTEYKMRAQGTRLYCEHCGASWELSEYGELKGERGFSHIPDWYEWERENVRTEVANGTYSFEAEAQIESLPNAKGFCKLGTGRLTHGMEGFTLKGEYENEPFEISWSVASMYSCHIEYNYNGKGACVDLNTLEDTFYIYPQNTAFAVTKIALATEELYAVRNVQCAVRDSQVRSKA